MEAQHIARPHVDRADRIDGFDVQGRAGRDFESRLGARIDGEVSGVDCDGWIDFAAVNWTVADCAGAVVDNKRSASNEAERLFTVTLLPFEIESGRIRIARRVP